MNTALQVVLVVLSAFSTLFMGLVLFVLRDLRDRIVRLEDHAMGGPVVSGIASQRGYVRRAGPATTDGR